MEHKATQIDRTNFMQDFFKEVEPIALVDPLATTLGVIKETEKIFYHYYEMVKFAGHSCLAVSGAFVMTKLALVELYNDQPPVRGEIKVTFKGDAEHNVNGPIAQVVSFITGAAGSTGFKGLSGKFSRYKLLSFDETTQPEKGVATDVEFERIDTGQKVRIIYRPGLVKKDPVMGELMPLILSGKATSEEKIKFGNLWQDGVKIILTNPPKGTFEIIKVEQS